MGWRRFSRIHSLFLFKFIFNYNISERHKSIFLCHWMSICWIFWDQGQWRSQIIYVHRTCWYLEFWKSISFCSLFKINWCDANAIQLSDKHLARRCKKRKISRFLHCLNSVHVIDLICVCARLSSIWSSNRENNYDNCAVMCLWAGAQKNCTK